MDSPATLTTSTILTPEMDQYLEGYSNLVQAMVDLHNTHYAFVTNQSMSNATSMKKICKRIKPLVSELAKRTYAVKKETRLNFKLAKKNQAIMKKLAHIKNGRPRLNKGKKHEFNRRSIEDNI